MSKFALFIILCLIETLAITFGDKTTQINTVLENNEVKPNKLLGDKTSQINKIVEFNGTKLHLISENKTGTLNTLLGDEITNLNQITKNNTSNQNQIIEDTTTKLNEIAENKTDKLVADKNVSNCKWSSKPSLSGGVDDISVICLTDIIDETFSPSAIGTHHLDQISSLNLTCDLHVNIQSTIRENMLVHVPRLRELIIENCKIEFWPTATLSNLSSLKNLTIRTRNIDWYDTIFELSQDSFQMAKHLEWLDLSMNNIYMLPDKIFCPIVNLLYLNISFNHLNDIRVLNFSDSMSSNPISAPEHEYWTSSMDCSFNLRVLDLSGNRISAMPSKAFSKLKFLEELHISKNNINIVSENALFRIESLKHLDMSWNKIVQLPENLFKNCSSTITIISFTKNSISALSPGLFRNLSHLISLDLSYNQLSDIWMNNNTFSGLIRLVMFNLSHNRISKLDETLFQDMYTLQVLSLEHNFIESLSPNIFKPLSNLHMLHLSYNRLRRIDAHSLNGLFVMNWVDLSHNEIESLHPQALRNCTGLQDFLISYNRLKYVPEVLRGMHSLQTVDLEKNIIEDIRSTDFEGMTNLFGLILAKNELKYISNKCFPSLPSLKILNLGGNKIHDVEKGAFMKLPKIEALKMEDNLLTTMSELFNEIESLLYLNLSNNRLSHFDYVTIPPSLLWLDLTNNVVSEISNMYELNLELDLETLYISYNNLTSVRHHIVLQNMKLLFLDNNQIHTVEAYSFRNRTNLKKVDLRSNALSHLPLVSLYITGGKEDEEIPKFYLGDNPFECDCEMEWLQKANSIQTTGSYPIIADLESLYCKMIYEKELITYKAMFLASSSKFLCEYEEHCFNLCRCCEYGACDCRMSCPINCTCYNDQTWRTNIVDCSNANIKEVPQYVPMDATTIYLDGNNITKLLSHNFIGRTLVTVLYLNNSNIEEIKNSTFTGMKNILTLHLENNKLTSIVGLEFKGLENLNELHLEHNEISYIQTSSFKILGNLTLLFLHGNQLYNYDIWDLNKNPKLLSITLSDNLWSCDCNYMLSFYRWYQRSTPKIYDFDRLGCTVDMETRKLGTLLKDINLTTLACHSFTEHISFYTRMMNDVSSLILLIAAVPIIFAPFVIIWIIRCRRVRTNIEFQDCFKVCCCKKSRPFIDLDQPYNAYITYSVKDESFVKQILLPGLAKRGPVVSLRVHHRDYNPVQIGATEFVANSVEKCEKIVLILSRNFIYCDWSKSEYKSALNGSLMRHRKPLFIIILGFITERDLDPDIRFYLRTNLSIEWGDSLFWERLKKDFLNPKGKKPNTYRPFSIQNRTNPRASIAGCSSSSTSTSTLRPNEFSNSDNDACSSQDTHYSTIDPPPRCVNTRSVWE